MEKFKFGAKRRVFADSFNKGSEVDHTVGIKEKHGYDSGDCI